ncbi:MAG: hypothetical protein ACI4A7_01900 [Prevotella sp.]
MKKVILFLMTFVSLVSFAGTTTTTTYGFSLDETESPKDSWHYKNVTNAKTAIENGDLAVGDKIVVEFTESSVKYAVCNENSEKILTGNHNETGSYNSEWKYYTSSSSTIKFKITSDLLSKIKSNGLRIEYDGSNLISKVYVERTTYNDGTIDPKTLTLGTATQVKETVWKYKEVLGISLIKLYDEVEFSFTATGESATNQYAICDAEGTKLVTVSDTQDWFDCPSGSNSYSLKITADILANIKAGGLRFEYNTGIEESSINVTLIKYDPSTAKDGEKLSVNKRLSEDNSFEDTDVSESAEVNTWYNLYRVNLPSNIAVGDTIRVYVKPLSKDVTLGSTSVTDELRDGMYAFLKTNTNGNPALMGGSDKFSIAGWDYYQFVYTNEISSRISGNYLIIGGYNYKMDGVYLLRHSETQAEKQENEIKPKVLARLTTSGLYVNNNGVTEDETVTDSNTKLPDATSNSENSWMNYQIKTKPIFSKIANNTQNLMVRIYTDAAHNVSLKDASNASYLIDYSSGKHAVYGSTGEHTVDGNTVYYKDVPVMDYIWENDGDKSIKGIVYNKHTLITQNDDEVFNVGVEGGTISKIEIVENTVKNNVSGQVTYKRTLQDNIFKPIALPYNLTYKQAKDVFGEGVKVMDLKDGRFVKSEKITEEKKEISYQIYINFHPIGWQSTTGEIKSYNDDDAYMIANYPYIIELGSGTKSEFKIPVVAELRDFTTYTAYVKAADFTYLGLSDDVKVTEKNIDGDGNVTDGTKEIGELTYWKNLFAKDYMAFTSTAPYFDVTANSGDDGQIDIYGSGQTSYKTVSLTRSESDPFYSQAGANRHVYYFYGGSLWRAQETKYFHSGLGFVELSSIFNDIAGGTDKYIPKEVSNEAETTVKLQYAFDEDMPTAIKGIVEKGTVQSHKDARQSRTGVFTINGQRINSSGSTEGLAKGFYIVNGKKVVIR